MIRATHAMEDRKEPGTKHTFTGVASGTCVFFPVWTPHSQFHHNPVICSDFEFVNELILLVKQNPQDPTSPKPHL